MRSRHLSLALAATLAAVPAFALSSNDAGDLVRAQVLVGKVMKLAEHYRAQTVVLQAPEPLAGAAGKYFVPYKADGTLTAWAAKSLNVAAGKVVGEKVGEKASQALAAKVPFGGLAGGLMKKKTKEVAATALLGGPDFIRQHTELSFAKLDDYAVYLHARHAQSPDYAQALAAAMTLYPDLEGGYEAAIKQAYRTQAPGVRAAAR